MKWSTKEYTEILLAYSSEYKGASREGKNDVIKKIKKDIKNSARNEGKAAPEGLTQKIKNWYQNNRHSSRGDESASQVGEEAPPRIKKWTLRSVVNNLMEDEICKLVQEKSKGARPGDSNYLKYYQWALSEVVSSLEEAEREEFEQIVDYWNEAGPDVNLQRKFATRKFSKLANRFVKDAKEQMGVDIFMMAGFKDSNGVLRKLKIETPGPVTHKFSQIFKIRGKEVWNDWGNYLENGCLVKPEDDSETSEEDEEEEKKSTDRSVPWPLEKDEKGWPVLPELPPSFSLQKDILRSFMTMTYRKTTCNPAARVPWEEILKDQTKYLSSKYIPDGIIITDPSRMHRDVVEKLLSFFCGRQQRSQKALRFKTVVLSDKRVGSSKFMFSSSGEESDDESMDLPIPPLRIAPVPMVKSKPILMSKNTKQKQKQMSSDSDSDHTDKWNPDHSDSLWSGSEDFRDFDEERMDVDREEFVQGGSKDGLKIPKKEVTFGASPDMSWKGNREMDDMWKKRKAEDKEKTEEMDKERKKRRKEDESDLEDRKKGKKEKQRGSGEVLTRAMVKNQQRQLRRRV